MGRKKPKKRKSDESVESPDPSTDQETESDTEDQDKYLPYRARNYSRKYPDNLGNVEYIVFLSHLDERPISEGTRMAISKNTQRVAGIKHMRIMNKFKVGVVFDNANNANMFLSNSKFMDDLKLTPTIPAGATEVTGVLTRVPVDMSNYKIFSLIASTRNIIQVRRFMRRVKSDDGRVKQEPTQTVAVTFASTELPDYVYLDRWRHEVKPYIPPVKQCLKCLRYGHISKFCKNSARCSICGDAHSFKECTVQSENAKCCNCQGNHIAISSLCPVKKQKQTETQLKAKTIPYSELFNEKNFPHLNPEKVYANFMNSDHFMNLLVKSVVKIMSLNKNKENISTNNIKNILKETFTDKKEIV